jgi:hypothetical protein
MLRPYATPCALAQCVVVRFRDSRLLLFFWLLWLSVLPVQCMKFASQKGSLSQQSKRRPGYKVSRTCTFGYAVALTMWKDVRQRGWKRLLETSEAEGGRCLHNSLRYPTQEQRVTFTEDITPWIWANCSMSGLSALTRVADDVEVRRAVFEGSVLRLTLARRPDTLGNSDVLIGRIQDQGRWVLRCDGRDVARGNGLTIDESPALDITAEPDGLALRCPPAGVHELEVRFV